MMCDKTILLIDDDEDDRDLLLEVLQQVQESATIRIAEDGLKALQYLEGVKSSESLPCLIVLDLNMPFLNGHDTFQRITEMLQPEQVPVIIFTSSSSPHDRQLFRRLGVEFITKPDDYNLLKKIAVHMLQVCDNGNAAS